MVLTLRRLASKSWLPNSDITVYINVSGGSLAPGSEMPSAETLVGWLLEHTELQVADLSDSDGLSSIDAFSDTDSMSDEFEDLDGAFGDVSIGNQRTP